MFELLLLIGFLYAGFFPPVPEPANRKRYRNTVDSSQHTPDQRPRRSRLAFKKLARKINNC